MNHYPLILLIAIFNFSCQPKPVHPDATSDVKFWSTDNADPIVAGTSSKTQTEEKGEFGYNLANEGYDLTRMQMGVFDITCQFKVKKDAVALHVIDQTGMAITTDVSHDSYCQKSVFEADSNHPNRYLLIGYTPKAKDAKDGSGIKKNFAISLQSYILQNSKNGIVDSMVGALNIDAYLFDHKVSTLTQSLAKAKETYGFNIFCSHLDQITSQLFTDEDVYNKVTTVLLENVGIKAAQIEKSQFWNSVRSIDIHGFKTQVAPLCSYSGGKPIAIDVGFHGIHQLLNGEKEVGHFIITSMDQVLFRGSLHVTDVFLNNRKQICRYKKMTPSLTVTGDLMPIIGMHSGVGLQISGKVCFDAYIHIENIKDTDSSLRCQGSLLGANCFPDHTISLVSDNTVNLSTSAFASGGATIANILEGSAQIDGGLELVDFDLKSSASSNYTLTSIGKSLFIYSLDYMHKLDAMKGKLSLVLKGGLSDKADALYESITNILKKWNKTSRIATTLSDFKTRYLGIESTFDLVQFPTYYKWDYYAHTNPGIYLWDASQGVNRFASLVASSCECFEALNQLLLSRQILIKALECKAAAGSLEDRLVFGQNKTQIMRVIGEMHFFCEANLDLTTNCTARSDFMNNLNNRFLDAINNDNCEVKMSQGFETISE